MTELRLGLEVTLHLRYNMYIKKTLKAQIATITISSISTTYMGFPGSSSQRVSCPTGTSLFFFNLQPYSPWSVSWGSDRADHT